MLFLSALSVFPRSHILDFQCAAAREQARNNSAVLPRKGRWNCPEIFVGGGGGRGVLFICTRPIVPRSVALAPLAESLDQANLAVVTQLS